MTAANRKPRSTIPLPPLLASIRADAALPADLTAFRQALAAARDDWFNPRFLDTATPAELVGRVTEFAAAHVPGFAHAELIGRSPALLRHGLTHLLRGADELPARFARCRDADGAYFVAGLGRRFWGCLLPAVAPDRLPLWLPEVERGLRRTGQIDDRTGPGSPAALDRACRVYESLLGENPRLTAAHLDALFLGAAAMTGRELVPATVESLRAAHRERVARAVRSVRTRRPLRKRLTEEGERLERLRSEFLAAVRAADDEALPAVLGDLLRGAGRLAGGAGAALGRLYAVGRESLSPPDGFAELAEQYGLPPVAVVLHLAAPAVFPPAPAEVVRAAAGFDDAFAEGLSPADVYLVLMSLLRDFRSAYRVHPFEFADVLAALGGEAAEAAPPAPAFGGFCSDSFRFFADLERHNSRDWMDAARPRYQFAVREPLVELCAALAARYVGPVLNAEYGWDVEADPRPGRALTSICKNDYGRSAPYQPTLWLTFYPRPAGSRRQAAQFFVRVSADGLRYGFHLGPAAREAGRRFRQAVQRHADALHRALAATAAAGDVTFAADDALAAAVPVRSAEELRAWAASKTLAAGRFRPAADPLLRAEELVGDVLLTFDRLVPLFAAAAADDPLPVLSRRAGEPGPAPAYDAAAFTRDTFLSDAWLDRTLGLLKLKRQLVLQGVPGTGKTHVARCLARLLAGGRPDAVSTVQFHPGYSYADFVEAPGPDAGDPRGCRDGVLLQAAARAAVRPAEAFVLLIDELTRGHLPTVFGELFFLLEYRGQTVTLPYSRRPFRLPENLYLVGTMNTADGSAAALDQALRRRFALVELTPDPALLARWLEAHPPAEADPTFGPRVVRLFEQLNARVARDFGPERQFGHSLFMVPGLDGAKLRAVWDHHVRPQLAELAADAPAVPAAYDLDRLLADGPVAGRPAVPVVP